ncbi:hypothetical protein [Streptomyces albipurpureus]|uniref:Uncharacterized protein n=1 Tax=Streptomyces albipurpureus TaxID=2897419 RepID=A0ABT0UZ93_9ACTN|nr:hypothetical protein [Streptomyces sp. CWNU-1]MCM2393591.1 hypothetical protein [Streptomyces sp. CWNU-1]
MSRTTVFAALLKQRGLTAFEKFSNGFRDAAARASRTEDGNLRLARVIVSRSTFDRWAAGHIKCAPH